MKDGVLLLVTVRFAVTVWPCATVNVEPAAGLAESENVPEFTLSATEPA